MCSWSASARGAIRRGWCTPRPGRGARVTFAQPFAPLELENFLLRIGRPRRPVRRVDAPETRAIKDFGERLYRALFRDDLRVSLERSLSEASAKGAGLRLRLRLSDTPELAELPWEFLYDRARNRFVCLSDRTPLVRFLEVPDPPRPLPVSPPLRVLVMISSPHDPRFAQLDVEQEWSKLQGALGRLEQAGQVRLERLEAATLPLLRQRLRRDDWHVLHFIGHGGFDSHAQDGVVVLEDPTGGSRLVTAQALGVPLHNHDPLRLVVLNACEGARVDPTDPFAGTAQTLVQQGTPAVVAMQFEITDLAAIALTSELYAAVADGYPLDAALSQARQALVCCNRLQSAPADPWDLRLRCRPTR
jgi:CHAT domain